MNTMKFVVALLSIILSSCGSSSSSDPAQNQPPVANAGNDRNVSVNTVVILDGSSSDDAEQDSLSYNWTLISSPAGSTASLSDATTAKPEITPDLLGDYEIELIVNDGQVDSSADTMVLSVINSAPVAVVSLFRTSNTSVGLIVGLNGSDSLELTMMY